MVHLTNCKKTEVVLFGADQEVRTPLFGRAGTCILVSAPAGSSEVRVSRFAVGQEDKRKIVSTRLEDVILAMTELGATFPDVAQFLTEAKRSIISRGASKSTPCRAGRYFDRSHLTGADEEAPRGKKRVWQLQHGARICSRSIPGRRPSRPRMTMTSRSTVAPTRISSRRAAKNRGVAPAAATIFPSR